MDLPERPIPNWESARIVQLPVFSYPHLAPGRGALRAGTGALGIAGTCPARVASSNARWRLVMPVRLSA